MMDYFIKLLCQDWQDEAMDQPKRIQVPEVTISSRIPRDVEEAQSRHPLLRRLWVSSAGYFPKAFGHITERAPEAVDF
jgi:hypothetical protein